MNVRHSSFILHPSSFRKGVMAKIRTILYRTGTALAVLLAVVVAIPLALLLALLIYLFTLFTLIRTVIGGCLGRARRGSPDPAASRPGKASSGDLPNPPQVLANG
jgi:hypothetical protein